MKSATGVDSFSLADYNRDGVMDLALAGTILLGAGGGSFHAQPARFSAIGRSSMASADFDGDGRPDLAAGNTGVAILFNTTP